MIKNFEQKRPQDLITALKQTTLLGDENIYPYENAIISLKTFNYKDISPVQFYYLLNNVLLLKNLKSDFKNHNIDILNLDGYVNFEVDNYDKKLTMSPPIIENVDGQNLLVDGMHRVVLSMMLGKNIKCAYIENIKPEHYTYAVSNPNGWRDVKLFREEIPENFKTRNSRYDGNYRYYRRMYNFEGKIQIPREHTLKTDSYFREMMSKQR